MTTKPKRIGVLTGGGDCPGLNAVIRTVTMSALSKGIEVVGIEDGFLGLIENRFRKLTARDVAGLLDRGGTILGSSNKANPIAFANGRDKDGKVIFENRLEDCLANLEAQNIDSIVTIGGDGTMTCAQPFVDAGINCIGVPKTIDNDIYGTEICFGFLTAVQVGTNALDRVRTTADSHGRALVVEVMGRNAGWVGLFAGVAGASDTILIPEIPFDTDVVIEATRRDVIDGEGYSVICVSEGARPHDGAPIVARVDPTSPDPIRLGGVAAVIAHAIEERTEIEARHVVLGHVQRGGSPTAADRILSTLFGSHAVEVLLSGGRNRMVARQGYKMTDVDIRECADRQRLVPPDNSLVRAARAIGTCFGDVLPTT